MKKIKNKLYYLFFFTGIILTTYTGIKITSYLNNRNQTIKMIKNIEKSIIIENDKNEQQIDFTSLKKQNNETVGWIKITNTPINYPIVQTNNNDYYLNHSFDKTTNEAGWIFSDFRNNLNTPNQNTIIYGHNRLDNTMFGSLTKIFKNKEPNKNYDINLITENTNRTYKIISIYSIQKEVYYITPNFTNEKDYQTFLDTIIKRSIYPFETKLTTTDKILTLSTCKDNIGTRIVIHAKLIKEETIK